MTPATPPRRPAPGEPSGDQDGLFVDDDDYEDHDDDYDDHDYVELPGEGTMPKWAAVAVVLVLLVGVVAGGGWWWWNRQIDPPGSPGQQISVEVPSGSSVSGIGSILENRGVVSNSMVFNFYAGRKNAGPFQAGVYRLRKNSDFDSVLRVLAAGPSEPLAPKVVRVSIPEGLTVTEIVARISKTIPRMSSDELQAALDGGKVVSGLRPTDQPSYEGLLFPATYEVASKTTGPELLGELAAEMEQRVEGLDVSAAQARISADWGLDLTEYELLTVASMIQSEAGNADEAPKIAAVIYNRLSEKRALGIDAVDQFGAEMAGAKVDYENDSLPYNTRRRLGLPPTPISAPGEYALEAAFNPAKGPWLYYVLEQPRVHTFVTTNAEFLAAKQICKERGLGCG
ncbi:MAG: endolytic transglycosylase MltG [Aquihabitans sp.]